jgi:hypothetical protein
MPRTEKKFGQVNQATSTTLSELVPTSANRRNVLINITARSASDISIATYTSAPSISPSITSYSLSSPIVNSAFTNAGTVISTNKSKTEFLSAASTDIIRRTYTVSESKNGLTLSLIGTPTNSSIASIAANINASNFNTPKTSLTSVNMGQDCYTNGIVALDDTYAITYSPQVTTTTSGQNRFCISSITAANIGSTHSDRSFLDTLVANCSYVAAFAFESTTSSDGLGVLMGINSDETGTTAALDSGVIRIFKSGAYSGRVNWRNANPNTNNQRSQNWIEFFTSADYNSTYPVYAFSHPNWANPYLGATAALVSDISGNVGTTLPTLPASQAPAGFRLVDTSGTNSHRKFLDGVATFPSAPTGVTVPTGSNGSRSVTSLKFSPDGTKLAVAYARNYSGTGDTNSVVVVYTRQGDGTYLHTNSSGASIRFGTTRADGMGWSSDSKAIFVASNSSLQEWRLESTSLDASMVTFSNGYTTFPPVAYYTNAESPIASGTTFSLASGSIDNGTGLTTARHTSLINIPGSSSTFPNVVILPRIGHNKTAGATVDTVSVFGHTATGVNGTGTAPGYINTVASNTGLAAKETIQISNVVLEANETIYVQPTSSGAIDSVAYGVEIS